MTLQRNTTTPVLAARSRNVPLLAARVTAGLLGAFQFAGVVMFLFLVPEEAVWLGPWLDVPIVTLMLAGDVLKLVVAGWPRLAAGRRIRLGFIAVAIGVAVTLVKISAYAEPEGVIFLAFDAVLLGLLLLAWRRAAQPDGPTRSTAR